MIGIGALRIQQNKEEYLLFATHMDRLKAEQRMRGYLSSLAFALRLITYYAVFPEHIAEIDDAWRYYCGRIAGMF